MIVPMSVDAITLKPETTKASVINFLHQNFKKVTDIVPLHDGLESVAYQFNDGNSSYVIRINASDYGFIKDAYAYKNYSSADVPIPAVKNIFEIKNIFYCISDYVSGSSESTDLDLLKPSPQLLSSVVDTLEGIHSTDISSSTGYGPWGYQGNAPYQTWRDYLLSFINDGDVSKQELDVELGVQKIDRIWNFYQQMTLFCPEVRTLVHGDFLPSNILVENDKIAAIIDWKYSMYGDPLFDTGVTSFIPSPLSKALIDKSSSTQFHNNHEERLLCYQLYAGIKNIRYGIRFSRAQWANIAAQACLNHIDRYLFKKA